MPSGWENVSNVELLQSCALSVNMEDMEIFALYSFHNEALRSASVKLFALQLEAWGCGA